MNATPGSICESEGESASTSKELELLGGRKGENFTPNEEPVMLLSLDVRSGIVGGSMKDPALLRCLLWLEGMKKLPLEEIKERLVEYSEVDNGVVDAECVVEEVGVEGVDVGVVGGVALALDVIILSKSNSSLSTREKSIPCKDSSKSRIFPHL